MAVGLTLMEKQPVSGKSDVIFPYFSMACSKAWWKGPRTTDFHPLVMDHFHGSGGTARLRPSGGLMQPEETFEDDDYLCLGSPLPRDTPSLNNGALRHQKGRLGTSPMYFRTEDSGFLGTFFWREPGREPPQIFRREPYFFAIYARVFGSFITL